MTTTYQGNNTGLEYDAATATWGLKNTTIEYIDTDAFASTDPDFVYTPPVIDGSIEGPKDPCPEGYMFDKELQQCVIDPNAENNFMDTTSGGGYQSNREERDYAVDPNNPYGFWVPAVQNADGTWEAGYTKQFPRTFGQFKQDDLVFYGKSKGYITKDGTIVGAMQASDYLGMWKGIGQFLNDRAYNTWLRRVQMEGMTKTVTGGSGTQEKLIVSVQPDDTESTTVEDPVVTVANPVVGSYLDNFIKAYVTNPNFNPKGTIGTSQGADKFDDIEQSKRRQEKAKARKEEAKARKEEAAVVAKDLEIVQTKEKSKQDVKDAEEKQDKTTQDAEERQRRNDQVQKDKDSGYSGSEQDTGGSGSGSSGSGSSYGSGSSEEYDKFEDKQGKPSGGYQRGGHHY
jgi:uncharacterized membrane protein YgcG